MLKISSPLPASPRVFGTVLALLAALVMTQAAAQTAATGKSSAPAAVRAKPRAPLDLHTPPLNHIYPSSELRYILAVDESSTEPATEVSIKSEKYVRVPGAPGNQLQAIPWALVHPTQAWRIFTPLEGP